MAWIESHQSLGTHPKTRKAARMLGVNTPTMVGHLHLLWHWALDLADDGDLSKFDYEDLAIGAQWEGDADEFVEALLGCGFGDGPGFLAENGPYGPPEEGLVGELVLHDWWDYAGKLVARRVADRRRKQQSRATTVKPESPAQPDLSDGQPPETPPVSDGHPADIPRTSNGKTGKDQNTTLHNPTEPKDLVETSSTDLAVTLDVEPPPPATPAGSSRYPPEFERFWNLYPRKVSKGQAVKAWRKARKKIGEPELLAAVETHARFWAQTQTETQFIPHAATWLNAESWFDELDPGQTKPGGRQTRTQAHNRAVIEGFLARSEVI